MSAEFPIEAITATSPIFELGADPNEAAADASASLVEAVAGAEDLGLTDNLEAATDEIATAETAVDLYRADDSYDRHRSWRSRARGRALAAVALLALVVPGAYQATSAFAHSPRFWDDGSTGTTGTTGSSGSTGTSGATGILISPGGGDGGQPQVSVTPGECEKLGVKAPVAWKNVFTDKTVVNGSPDVEFTATTQALPIGCNAYGTRKQTFYEVVGPVIIGSKRLGNQTRTTSTVAFGIGNQASTTDTLITDKGYACYASFKKNDGFKYIGGVITVQWDAINKKFDKTETHKKALTTANGHGEC